jgi:hypothetical protein
MPQQIVPETNLARSVGPGFAVPRSAEPLWDKMGSLRARTWSGENGCVAPAAIIETQKLLLPLV